MKLCRILSPLLLSLLLICLLPCRASADTYTLHYLPNGATGTMEDTVATCGQQATLAQNTFELDGSIFLGWTARRESDGTWLYRDSATGDSDWYTWGSQPSGWSTYLLTDGRSIASLTATPGDEIGLYAKWNSNTYTIRSSPTDGTGTTAQLLSPIGDTVTLPLCGYTCEGKAFKGWTARRDSDGTWLYQSADGTSSGWYTWGSQPSGWSIQILHDGATVSSMAETAGDTVVLYAKWTDNAYHVEYNNGGGTATMTDSTAAIGYPHTLTPNAYTCAGKRFTGWTVRRNSDGTWLYQSADGASTGWYTWGSQPSGWTTPKLTDGQQILDLTTTKGDTIELYAKWADAASFTAMSFNVRNTNADTTTRDAQNGSYPDYPTMVTDRILEHHPDTVGLQEVSTAWYDYLTASGLMDTYAIVGHGRNADGTGEATPILYDKTRFTLLESDTRWLTADGTYGLNTGESYPRILTYALLQRKSDGARIMVVNTHLALGEAGRLEQIGILADFLSGWSEYPVILTGDMNTEMTETGVYNAFCDMGLSNAAFLAKTDQDLSSPTFTRYGTYSKILDYLLLDTDHLRADSYQVCDQQIDGYDVSDHFPILVEYSLLGDPQPITAPTLTLKYPSLSFEDEIVYNVYFTAEGLDDVVEMGLATFDTQLTDGTLSDATNTIPGFETDGTLWKVSTTGIPAKAIGDTLYFKVYAKLSDGTYVYTEIKDYSAVTYATTILDRSTSSEHMKALVVAMLDYGTEAQLYFGHNTDALMNASLTAEQQALVSAYDASMVDATISVDSAKAADLVYDGSSFTRRAPSVSFDSAFAINYYFTPAHVPDAGMTLYYWDLETYDATDVLTTDNATGMMEMVAIDTTEGYWGQVSGIAAKELDETVFVAGVYTHDGTTYTTGILSYSLGSYCKTIAARDSSDQCSLAQATAVYGYYAKAYFAQL